MTMIDKDAVDTIAAILGANSEWSSEMLEHIADVVGRTGRPHPGSSADDVVAMYRAEADRLSVAHDGPELDDSDDMVTCDGCPAVSESGWGDTELCIDCEAPERICDEHSLTHYDDEPCPACKTDDDGTMVNA